MVGASIETTLGLWASSLRDVKARIRPLFRQERVAASAWNFLDGLLGSEPRKTGWMRAEAAGDLGPWRQQAILGRGRWDAEALRDMVRDYALETLADEEAVLVIDETGFLKQGKASCGVARQYTGSAGKITNCQIGVFASYVSRHGHAFIDRALYLPKAWTDDPERMATAHVPDDVCFATKPQIACRMIVHAIAAKVPFFLLRRTRGLLIRRNIADGDLAFFSTWCPKDTPMKKLVSVEGHRWAIEDSFETAKNELGLDHNETRSWHGWHRHVSLVMLAFAMMAVIRHRANITSPPKKMMLRLRTKRRS
jgi:SRSO17 transposase